MSADKFMPLLGTVMFTVSLLTGAVAYAGSNNLKGVETPNSPPVAAVLPAHSSIHRAGKTYLGHSLTAGNLVITLPNAKLVLRPVNNETVEVVYNREGVKLLPSFALKNPNQQEQVAENSGVTAGPEPMPHSTGLAPHFVLKEHENDLTFESSELQVHITKSPFNIAYYKQGKLLTQHAGGFFHFDALRGVRFALQENEKLLGGGQRVLGMDRRGKRLPLYNKTHWGYSDHSDAMYYSLPAVMSSNQYIIAFDNSAKGHLDIGAYDNDVLQFEAVAGRNAYIISVGDGFVDLINNYTDATGKQPLPPRWALGSLAARFGYRNEAEVRNVVAEYQKQDFPLDGIILDLFWFGKDVKGHMGSLQWDREAFPTPKKMIQDFSDDNVKTLLITEPYIINSSKQWQSAVDAEALAKNPAGGVKKLDMFFGQGGLVDVFDPKAQDWFWQFYQRQFEQGVAGVWGDLGEPEAHPDDTIHALGSANEIHNAYGHQWARFLYEKYAEHYPNQRLFLLMRSGFLGSQRYGMLPWTGDVERTWGGLGAQVELSLQMGVLGLAYTHSDLGGFARNEVFDPKLYIRWLQYGTFQPIYRVHGIESVAPEPIFHDKKTKDIVRDYMKLRYQLLPYNYTLSYVNSTQGTPMMRPLFFDEPNTLESIDYKSGYFWGDAFWVEPVTLPNQETQTVYLPKGVWFDYWSGEEKQGGKTFEHALSLEQLPVWVRAGSFVPMAPEHNNTQDYTGKTVNLHYYHHPSVTQSQGQWYEDDGKNRHAITLKNYRHYQLTSASNAEQLTLRMKASGEGYQTEPSVRHITWVIHHVTQKPKQVLVNQRPVEYQYNEQKHQLMLPSQVNQGAHSLSVTVNY